jgi:hypothetical protein
MAELLSVQAVPQGLLELLGMKGSGVNPKTLDSVVQGVLDVRQAYALSRLSNPFDGFNTGGQGTSAIVTVPEGQIWMLLSVVGTLITGDALSTEYGGSVDLSFSSVGRIPVAWQVRHNGAGTALPNNDSMNIPFVPPYPMLLRGGASIEVRCSKLIGGAVIDVGLEANVGIFS